MGLDQYAFTCKPDTLGGKQVDFDEPEGSAELAYWRKHPDLQGWLESLYREKGGAQDFNCVPVRLTMGDIERLERDVDSGALPHTEGFFFGTSQPERHDHPTRVFIERAKIALLEGMAVYYTSWW